MDQLYCTRAADHEHCPCRCHLVPADIAHAIHPESDCLDFARANNHTLDAWADRYRATGRPSVCRDEEWQQVADLYIDLAG